MSRSNQRSSRNVVGEVLAFLMRHWRREAWCVAGIAISMTVATAADLMLPIYSGHLVNAVANGGARLTALRAAGYAIAAMAGLGAVLAAARYLAFLGIVRLTVRLMRRMARDAFCLLQRLLPPTGTRTTSPDRSCAGSRAASGPSTCSTTRCCSPCCRRCWC